MIAACDLLIRSPAGDGVAESGEREADSRKDVYFLNEFAICFAVFIDMC